MIGNQFTTNVDYKRELSVTGIRYRIETSSDTVLKDLFNKIPLMNLNLSCRQVYSVIPKEPGNFWCLMLRPLSVKHCFRHCFSYKISTRIHWKSKLKIRLTSLSPNLTFLVVLINNLFGFNLILLNRIIRDLMGENSVFWTNYYVRVRNAKLGMFTCNSYLSQGCVIKSRLLIIVQDNAV